MLNYRQLAEKLAEAEALIRAYQDARSDRRYENAGRVEWLGPRRRMRDVRAALLSYRPLTPESRTLTSAR